MSFASVFINGLSGHIHTNESNSASKCSWDWKFIVSASSCPWHGCALASQCSLAKFLVLLWSSTVHGPSLEGSFHVATLFWRLRELPSIGRCGGVTAGLGVRDWQRACCQWLDHPRLRCSGCRATCKHFFPYLHERQSREEFLFPACFSGAVS